MMRIRFCSCIAAFLLMGSVCLGLAPVNGDAPTTAVLAFQTDGFRVLAGEAVHNQQQITLKADQKDSGSEVIRGAIRLRGTGEILAYAWDKNAGKLYVDLNGNGDPTDDPKGAVESVAKGNSPQVFSGIPVSVKKDRLQIPYVLNITFYSNQPSVVVQSGWSGEIELNGHKWRVGTYDQTNAALINEMSFTQGPPMPVYYSDVEGRRVFLDGQLYEISLAFAPRNENVDLIATFKPVEAKLGKMRLTGSGIHRLVLTTPDQPGRIRNEAVFYDPPAEFEIPEGSWLIRGAYLKNGDDDYWLNYWLNMKDMKPAVVAEGQVTTLSIGTPLHNKIEIGEQSANQVVFNYKLVDDGGHEYLGGPMQAEFEILKDGKRIESGRFQYG